MDDRDLDRGLELGAQLDELQEDDGGREDGGVQERDAADFEDGGVERGQGGRREGEERHAADLEDVGDDDEDENVIVARRRRSTFQGDCLSGRSNLECFNSFESRIQLFFLSGSTRHPVSGSTRRLHAAIFLGVFLHAAIFLRISVRAACIACISACGPLPVQLIGEREPEVKVSIIHSPKSSTLATSRLLHVSKFEFNFEKTPNHPFPL